MKKYVFIVLAFIMMVFPLLLFILKSFTGVWRSDEPFQWEWTTTGWNVLLTEPNVIGSIQTSFLLSIIVLLLNLFLGILTGRALSFYLFKGKKVLESLLLLPLFLPTMAVALGLQLLMIRLQLADHIIGVALVHLIPTVPYSIKMLRAGYDQMGYKIVEQARLLGANRAHVFWTVELPSLLPSVRSVIFLTVIISLGQYLLTAIIGGGNVSTLAIIYYPYSQSANDNVMAAFSIVFALVPLVLFIIIEFFLRLFVPLRKTILGGTK